MKRLRLKIWLATALLLLAVGLPCRPVSAGKLQQRTVILDTSRPGAVTTHTFDMTLVTNTAVGSIVFEYCSNNPLFDQSCTVPSGINLSTANLSYQAGATGFTIDSSSTGNKLVLTRPSAVVSTGTAQYVFGNVTNPSTTGAQYVRISTHASNDGSGARIDDGGVAYSIQNGINTAAYVPPFLVFCSAINVSLDCSGSDGFYIDLGELSTSQTKVGQSQYSGATNDEEGYTVSIFGTTLTSGNNVIPALVVPSVSSTGTSQFGINLRANSNPSSGQDPVGIGTSVASGSYGTPNLFQFVSGDTISSSPVSTEFNRFTVTYMTNVSSSQPPGVYAATYTFIAVASF